MTLKQQDSHFWYPIYAKLAKIPLMVIYYEDLKEDVIPQMNRVHKFYEDHFNITFDDRELRLGCLVEEWDFLIIHEILKVNYRGVNCNHY